MKHLTTNRIVSILVAVLSGMLVTLSIIQLYGFSQIHSCTTYGLPNPLTYMIGIPVGIAGLIVSWYTFGIAEKK